MHRCCRTYLKCKGSFVYASGMVNKTDDDSPNLPFRAEVPAHSTQSHLSASALLCGVSLRKVLQPRPSPAGSWEKVWKSFEGAKQITLPPRAGQKISPGTLRAPSPSQ